MGCKTNVDRCDGFINNSSHCANYKPGAGVSYTFSEYPAATIRTGNYNIPGRDANAVMYDSLEICASTAGGVTTPVPDSPANCGKLSTSTCNSNCTLYFDYYPSQLSFDYGLSDSWFAYLYDTSSNAGVVGTPCYYIETRTRTSSSSTPGELPEDPPTTSSSTETTTTCIPCTAFYCDTAETNLRYTAGQDVTGDPDCPHPTLFGFGTSSKKLAFTYNQLSTQLPNGVLDFSFSYDGVTYTDVWDEGALEGVAYESSQNPWQSGDENFTDFEIFEPENSPTATGLRLKVYIEPIFDDTGPTVVFSGTRWTVAEFIAPGTGYAVNDVYTLEYVYTHPDQTTTTLSMNLKVTSVGPVDAVSGQEGFDVLRIGDTINGHTITRTFHTDINNFLYHVIYLDGNGNDFTKDTQYTSNRNHVITAKAGYGIVDRAILVGTYEFMNKSVQYVTADVDKDAPQTLENVTQPTVTATITNGRVTALTIVDGGEGWNTLNRKPVLEITNPIITTGKKAEIEGTFSNGVLTNITITDGGSGYTQSNPPQVFISNIFKQKTETFKNDAYNAQTPEEFKSYASAIPSTEEVSVTSDDLKAIDDAYSAVKSEFVSTTNTESIRIKQDPDRNRTVTLPQKLFSKTATDKVRKTMKVEYDDDYIQDAPLDRSTKDVVSGLQPAYLNRVDDIIDNITQEKVPEFDIRPESKIETVQGSLKFLPKASQYTKYLIRQYRPDTATDTTINITLSCSPVDSGCGHFTCTAPTATPGGSSTSEPDPETGTTTTTTDTYSVSPLLGDGCKSWSISGTMKMFHNRSRAAENVGLATSKYGNPYDD